MVVAPKAWTPASDMDASASADIARAHALDDFRVRCLAIDSAGYCGRATSILIDSVG
jgi:hypothetical protein